MGIRIMRRMRSRNCSLTKDKDRQCGFRSRVVNNPSRSLSLSAAEEKISASQ